jgi:hypothetical protein
MGTSDAANSAPALAAIEIAGDEIKTAQPEIADATLDDDQNVVYQACVKITALFKERGFDRRDAEEAVISTWKGLRIGSKPLQITVSLKLDILLDRAGDLGKLVIASVPDEAEIALDDNPEGYTEKGIWITPGKYKVRLSKSGYKSVEDVCEVKKGKKTEFKRELTSIN